jgi:uncharacterized membrane protein YbhN (UPF0104 family)
MSSFIHAVQVFFDHIASVALAPLALAILCHLLKMACRARAWGNIVAAAYPGSPVLYRHMLGAYAAGVGVNALVPARGGDVVKLFLAKRKVKGATYPTLASTFVVEAIFDVVAFSALLGWVLWQGLLPGLDAVPRLPAFGVSWMIGHPFASAGIALGLIATFGYLGYRASRHVVAFWRRVAQGFSVLEDRRLYVRSVVTWQAADWCFRILGVIFLLQAFGIAVDVGPLSKLESGLVVQVVNGASGLVPFTPSGIGTEQALVVYTLAGKVSTTSLLAFSVGSTLLAIAINVTVGFGAILLMLRTLRWKERIAAEQVLPAPVPVAEQPSPPASA